MAKKWKAYPWPDRQDDDDTSTGDNHEVDTSELIIGERITDTVHEHRRRHVQDTEDEEIDVVGDSTATNAQMTSSNSSSSSNNVESGGNRANQQTCWGPHSPTAGATAPSPPPLNAAGALYYHGIYRSLQK